MSNESLGARLAALQAKGLPDELRALQQQARTHSPCATEDLTRVMDFFLDAMARFATAIAAGVPVRPVILGNGCNEKVASILQTFRWKHGYCMSEPGHPYHAVWGMFAAWCADHELAPAVERHCDEVRNEPWHTITVRPALPGMSASA